MWSSITAAAFFPGLPVRIPYSPGMEHWWDIFWWAFQIAAMTYLLVFFRKSADRVDSQFVIKIPGKRHKKEKP
jgi:hypothetical protein